MTKRVDFLEGIRVLLIGHYIPCPFAAYLLRGLGARVIKIEPPFGDLMRELPPFIRGKGDAKISAYFRAFNGGFESMALDLKQAKGVDLLAQLLQGCDVVLDGNRPGYLSGILGRALEALNEDIIHVPITAHGLKGPLRNVAGHDNNVLARSGVLSFNTPVASVSGVQIADISAGFTAAVMVLANLLGRRNPLSKAQINVMDVSMLHAASAMTQMYVAGMNANPAPPMAERELLNGKLPNYRRYETADHRWVFFGPIEAKLFGNFAQRVEDPDLMELFSRSQRDPEARRRLHEKLEALFSSRSLEAWEEALQDCDCCLTGVKNLDESIDDPQMRALKLVVDVEDPRYGALRLPGYPAGFTEDSLQPTGIHDPAPELGEHSLTILRDVLRMDDESCEELLRTNVVRRDAKGTT